MNILLSIFLLLVVAGIGTICVLWMMGDLTGEYSCISSRLGMVRLSLFRKGEVMKGELNYAHSVKLDLITIGSMRQEDVNLSFGTPRDFPRKGVIKRVDLIGKFENGAIFGVLVDGGTPYPVNLHRNIIYSMVKRLSSIFGV
jgi:hypothetical protein